MSAKTARTVTNLFNFIVIISMMFGPLTALPVQAFTDTDKEDYLPGSTVTVYGDNRDGAGYLPGETVQVTVTQPVSSDPLTCEGVADENGAWSCQLVLSSDPAYAVGLYAYVTLGLTSGVTENHSFTDAPPPNLEQLWQCDPPSVYDPSTYTCVTSSATGWVTGNNDGPFKEGETIPYRTRMSNLLSANQYTITIEWDTTKDSKHAIDYLKTYNATITAADPCASLTGLPAGLCSTSTTFPIPSDTFMQANSDWIANAGVQDAGVFTMFGGTITGVSTYTTPASYTGNTSTSITISFTATSTDIVLAWGGHIGERDDWGQNNSAVAISGSPYHMRILSWYDVTHSATLNVGNTDRSLSTEAVIYPASITIIKNATPDGSTSFPFTASPSPLANFSLVDDGTTTNTKVFSDIINFQTYTITENTPAGWTFGTASCSVTSANGGSQTVNGAIVTIVLKEGENVTCTYTNTRNYDKDLTVSKTATASFGRDYKWLIDKSVDDTLIEIAEGGKATFNYSVKVTPNDYDDSAWAVSGKITVTNPNAFAVSGVDVTDAIDNGGVCSVTSGTNVTVPASGSVELDYSCTYSAEPSPAAGTNTATATWTSSSLYSEHTSATGTASVDFSTVTPVETNKTITVVDDKIDPLNPVTLGTWNWADGEHSFTYALDKSGVAGICTDYTNTAVIDETAQSDTQKVTVCVAKDLTVEKSATAALNRTYKWLIDKSVDDTRIEIADGGTATFNYSVKVTPDGFADSDWTLGGTITIANPNDWEDITVDVADTLDQGGTCTITEESPYIVPMGDSLTLHYTCASDGTTSKNTATITWDKAVYFTPNDSVSADAVVSFTLATEVNKTITVIDDKTDPQNPVTLGTVDWEDGEYTFTYSLDKEGVAGKCTDYPNTAVIDETGQNDTQKVTVCVGLDLTMSKTAAGTFDRTYLWTISKDVDKTSVNIADGGSATFTYTVDVAQTGISDSGWTLSGKITISNPNDWEDITLTSLADAVDNGGLCTVDPGPYLVAKGGSLDVNYSCSFGSTPSSYDGTNTATATWDAATYFTPSGSASGSAEFTLDQSVSTNKTINVTDTYGGALGTATATDSAPYASASFTYDRIESGVGGTCTDYDNTATITETGQTANKSVTLCVGKDLTVSKTAEGTFNREYLWEIFKVADNTTVNIASGGIATFNYTVNVNQTGFTDSGWFLGGTIRVTNPNDWEDITVDVTDIVDNGGDCTVVDGTVLSIPAEDFVDLVYTCSYSSAPSSYDGTNTATATWDKEAAFTPTGSASGQAAFTLERFGETHKTVNVTDTLGGALGEVTATDEEPFATATFTYSHDFAGIGGRCTGYDNTATITETEQSASKKVTVCVGLDLTVTKTAAGSFDRTYHWLIDKSVDDTSIDIAEGGTATFNYTVDVTPNGYTDGGWTLAGKITVTNPNDWEDITADVTDSFAGGGVCSVIDGEDVVIAASGSVTLDYSCEFSSEPIYAGKNTATATWDSATYFTPTGTASGEADVTLELSGETDRTITVVDDKTEILNPVTLGTSDYYSGPFEFIYSLEKQGVAGECTDYTNTAVIDETDQSDVQTVTVCVGKDLTIEKTAVPTFTRTWEWTITKDFDASYTMFAGQDVSHGYKVTVTPESTDSLWKVDGVITISNPNAWEAITLTSLADVVDNGGDCTVDDGPYVIPASGSLDVNYSCIYTSAPSNVSGKNTATATWDSAAYFTPTGTASGDQSFTFANPTEINPVITVDDDNLTDEVWGADRAYAEWTYTKTFACSTDAADYTDGTYSYSKTNTATINETGDSDTATVDVTCNRPQLKVSKTVNQKPFSGPDITFELREGAAPVDGQFGAVLETETANVSNNGQVIFDTMLTLGNTYQLCEYVPEGYVPSYTLGVYGIDWFKPGYAPGQGGLDPNILVCVNFTVNAEDGSIDFQNGQQIVALGGFVNVDNQVGQMPRTIGYWKNHASAKSSNGSQDPVLDQMLYKATQDGHTIQIGTLLLPGGSTPDDAGTSATYAVRLLNKSTITTNKKMASDPCFNLAAQLLGYRLNQPFGAWTNTVAAAAADYAQAMLLAEHFNGITHDKLSKQAITNLNYLAGILDAYNNDTLAIATLAIPYPGVYK